MKWMSVKDEYPEERRLLLVFRHKKRHYCLAYFKLNSAKNREEWITQHGNIHQVDPEDGWSIFKFYSKKVSFVGGGWDNEKTS